MTQFLLGEPEGNPTFDQFRAFARRLGVEVRTRGPFFRKLADRGVVAVEIEIRQASGDAAWRRVAPWIHPLEGQDRDGLVARVARPLAWLRFCDLAALPRLPGVDGWSDVSVKAVADHVCAMLGLDQPDIGLLERCLAAWRETGVVGPPPAENRRPGADRSRGRRRRTAQWREVAALLDRISDPGAPPRPASIPAGSAS